MGNVKDPMGVNALVAFIGERENIRVKKERGDPRPWTKDPILGKYRFCNVHREDDTVTRWLRANWYPNFRGDPDIWFAAVVARLLNNPESLEAVGISRKAVIPYRAGQFAAILHKRKREGLKNFNAAYIVSTNGVAMDKVDYIAYNILEILWLNRSCLRPKAGMCLDSYHKILMGYDGLGSFIAAQVIADLKYMQPLKSALDWGTFAASGPGSRRGLNRWRGYTPDSPYKEDEWREDLLGILPAVNAQLARRFGMEALHAQDLQNCLCEFDKYERARLGEGTPKQIYKEKK